MMVGAAVKIHHGVICEYPALGWHCQPLNLTLPHPLNL
jgi:hypothetical protein